MKHFFDYAPPLGVGALARGAPPAKHARPGVFRMFKSLILAVSIFAAVSIPTAKASANTGYTFEWSNGFDGYGHCYQVTLDEQLLNGENPVDNWYCH